MEVSTGFSFVGAGNITSGSSREDVSVDDSGFNISEGGKSLLITSSLVIINSHSSSTHSKTSFISSSLALDCSVKFQVK